VSASAGGTFAGNVAFGANATFGDNDKAVFGAGSDLQIYHNGSDSVISESASGNLLIQGDNLYLQNPAGSSTYIRAKNGLEVDLRYNGSPKLATTATGVTVTGNVDTSGTILVGGTNSVFAENNLNFNSGGASYIDHSTVGQAINFRVSNASSLDTTAMTISSTGVISGDGSGLTGVGASTSLNAVGTYALMRTFDTSTNNPGSTYAGSSLKYCTAQQPAYYHNSTGSGTYRCMGYSSRGNFGDNGSSTTWVRIA
jgi:hypothetical protein